MAHGFIIFLHSVTSILDTLFTLLISILLGYRPASVGKGNMFDQEGFHFVSFFKCDRQSVDL